jgi:predicted nucleic acid-binding protein
MRSAVWRGAGRSPTGVRRRRVGDLASVRLLCYPHAPLREGVWARRSNLSAYDATYLALAEALDDPVLLTADRGLATAAGDRLGENRVHHIP